ncbi:MAG: sigma-70 family RNA polymerase sigma factor [Planctomycetota bacterium]
MACLVHRYQGPLYGFLLRWCRDAHRAEDMFQEVFLKLVRSRHQFDPRRRFRPYLYRIALNTLRDAYLVRATPTEGFEPDAVPEPKPGPLAGAAAAERHAHVRAAIARLPHHERIVVELRMYQGLTFREVAHAIGVKVPTAKSRMVYALRKLRPALAVYLPEGDR